MKDVVNLSDTDVRIGLNLLEITQEIDREKGASIDPAMMSILQDLSELRDRVVRLESRTWWSMLREWVVQSVRGVETWLIRLIIR